MSVAPTLEFYQLHQGATRKHSNGYSRVVVTHGAAVFIQGDTYGFVTPNKPRKLDPQLPVMVVTVQPDTHARVEP